MHDSRILENLKLYEKFREGELPCLPNGVILGDRGYPLLEWLLVPFVEYPGMMAAQKCYNKAHKSTRAVYRENNRYSRKKMGVPKWIPIQARKMLRSIIVCVMLHKFCRNVLLKDDEEEATKTTSMKLKRVDEDARNLFVRFLHNPYNPLKLMAVFKYFQKVEILISYECNSSSPLTFFEIRLHAIVILLQYLLIMFVAGTTFFSRTA